MSGVCLLTGLGRGGEKRQGMAAGVASEQVPSWGLHSPFCCNPCMLRVLAPWGLSRPSRPIGNLFLSPWAALHLLLELNIVLSCNALAFYLDLLTWKRFLQCADPHSPSLQKQKPPRLFSSLPKVIKRMGVIYTCLWLLCLLGSDIIPITVTLILPTLRE